MSWNEDKKDTSFKRTKKTPPSTAKEAKVIRDESETIPDAVIHCVVEAIEVSAMEAVEHYGINDMVEEGSTPKEVFQKLLDDDNVDALIALASIPVIHDIHTAVHQAMQGYGIKDLEDKELRAVTEKWFNSDKFANKYDSHSREELKTILGAE